MKLPLDFLRVFNVFVMQFVLCIGICLLIVFVRCHGIVRLFYRFIGLNITLMYFFSLQPSTILTIGIKLKTYFGRYAAIEFPYFASVLSF